ncbi:MAG: hypothetical protein JWN46_3499, partial [Acidimicrobiales bacterium]|nr:hypothetical protein [Acidimicrobiales bacterium]
WLAEAALASGARGDTAAPARLAAARLFCEQLLPPVTALAAAVVGRADLLAAVLA